MFDTSLQDLRYAVRTLAARPGFSAAVVLTLALGIGANTLVFSLINGIYLKALPYRDDAALIDLSNRYGKSGPQRAGVSIPDYLDRRADVPALADSALYADTSLNLSTEGTPERLRGLRVTPSLFSTLGIGATLGRTFSEDEAQIGKEKVVVLGNALWRNRFNADPTLVGRDLRLNGESWRVVGVMPESFMFPNRDVQLYVPFAFTEEQKGDRARGQEFSDSVARLAPGADLAQVKAQCDAIVLRNYDRIGAMGVDGAGFRTFMQNAGFTVNAQPLRALLAGQRSEVLFLLQGAVSLVLLIACANIANLLLTRFSTRRKEISVRSALGAGRARIARQLLIEALLLALVGGTLGLGIAIGGAQLVASSGLVPDWVVITPDARVLGFGLALSLAAGVLFGLFPVLSAVGMRPQQALREAGRLSGGGRGARRTRNVLVVVQLALAVTLLAGSGLLLRSFAKVLDESPGFRSTGVLSAAIALPRTKYPDGKARARGFARILEDVRKLPGVDAVGLVDSLPFATGESGASYRIEGRDDGGSPPHGHVLSVDEDYFKAMGIPLLQGRTFTRADWDAAAPVVLIDEMFARKQFPAGDAIGHRLDFGMPSKPDLYTIVGIVGTTRYMDLAGDPREETYYFNFANSPSSTALLSLRSSAAASALVEPLRAAIRNVDPDLPLFDVKTMDERIGLSLAGRRVPMQLLGGFALLALLLAGIGIYGVLAFAVAQRTGEFGVRMAIGADIARIRRHVLGDGAHLVGLGIGVGVLGAFALGLVLKSQLFGVGSIDLPSLAIVVGVLAATAFVACWLPARRAASIAPLEALRYE
jgi:predicted permease